MIENVYGTVNDMIRTRNYVKRTQKDKDVSSIDASFIDKLHKEFWAIVIFQVNERYLFIVVSQIARIIIWQANTRRQWVQTFSCTYHHHLLQP